MGFLKGFKEDSAQQANTLSDEAFNMPDAGEKNETLYENAGEDMSGMPYDEDGMTDFNLTLSDDELQDGTEANADLPSNEVTEIAAGAVITGSMESDGCINIHGKIIGDVTCKGKMVITGTVNGVLQAGEIFTNNSKIEGDIKSDGSVKIGNGSVIIGNIYAASAVIGGAVKGDIDVQGPVIVDTTAVVQGNIKSRSVQINNGAAIEGFCSQCYADVDYETLFDDTFGK